MKDQKTKNVGAHAYDLLQKQPDTTDAVELQREMLNPTEWEQDIQETVESAQRTYPSNFYVVVLFKRERIITNAIRYYMVARRSCPTPQYDQVVYYYDRNQGDIQFIWSIPDQMTSIFMYQNALSVPKEQRQQLNYVIQFFDGSLQEQAQRLNGEGPYGSRIHVSTA